MKEHKIPFKVNLYVVIDKEQRKNLQPLYNGILKMYPSQGTPNTGVIILKGNNLKKTEAWNQAKDILNLILKDHPNADNLVIEPPVKIVKGNVRATIVKGFEDDDLKTLQNKVQLKLGTWILGKRIGKGGQAEVFEVLNDNTKALKLFKIPSGRIKNYRFKKKLKRYKREVDCLKKMKGSENVIEIFDNGEESDSDFIYHYYVMEKADKTLAEFVRKKDLSIDKIFNIYKQILNGTKNIHQFYIHRDLKPANIYIWDKGHKDIIVKIGDFGIAFHPNKDRITDLRERVGPYYFMAPELEEGLSEKIDKRADLYSLGKILYYLLSKGRIFNREKFDEDDWNLGVQINERYYSFLPLFRKTINRSVDERFKGIEDLIEDFKIVQKEFNNFPIIIDFGIILDEENENNFIDLSYAYICEWLEIDLNYLLINDYKKRFIFIHDDRDREIFAVRGIFYNTYFDEIGNNGKLKWWEVKEEIFQYVFKDEYAYESFERAKANYKGKKRFFSELAPDKKEFSRIMNKKEKFKKIREDFRNLEHEIYMKTYFEN